MAIYHAHVSSGSRSGGQSGAAKVAYVLRRGKYAGRYDLVVSGYGNLPEWAGGDPCALFAAADLYERANGRLFVEVEVALPNEMTESQRHELVRAIAAAVTAPGLPFTYSIHAGRPKSPGEPANPHGHILLSERVNDGIERDAAQWFRRANRKDPGAGGAAKYRGMKDVSWVGDTRKVIEHLINAHLERAQVAERVTAESHATRIEKALAAGDMETAEWLRQHPAGMHLGPTAAALERDRFRQKEGEDPELSRAGEPTDRGERYRARAMDAQRLVAGMKANGEALDHARAESQRAEQAVERARAAGLLDEEILRIYESAESGSGWAMVEAATASRVGRKQQAEAAAGKLDIDVAAVYRSAQSRGAEPVSVLEEATTVFAEARAALLPDVEIWRLYDAAESAEPGTGWAAARASSSSRRTRKKAAEEGAETFGLNVAGIYTAAIKRGADPVEELARSVEQERQAAASARAEARRRTAVEDLEAVIGATKKGSAWLANAGRKLVAGAGRELTLEERERIAQVVAAWIRADFDQRKETLAASETGAWFLREAQSRRAAASAPSTLATEEQQIEVVEQQLREHEAAEKRRAAQRQELFQQPGGEHLYYAVLTGVDPTWRDRGRTAGRHIDTALTTAASDNARLGRLRDILADPNDAACYRTVLTERGDRFTIEDVDAAVDAAFARREAEAARQREEEEKRKRKAKARRATRLESLSPAGRELHAAWLASLSRAGRGAGGLSGADIDRALDATASDARLQRLEAVLEDAEQQSCYRGALGSTGGRLALDQVDAALQATEAFVVRKNTIFGYPGGSQHPSGEALWAAALESLSPVRPSVKTPTAVLDKALARVEFELKERVQLTADEVEKLLPTTRPYPHSRPDYRVPALSDDLVNQLGAKNGDAFAMATIVEVRKRYARRARHDTRDENRYGPRDRLESERAHLADVIEMTWDRERRSWSRSRSSKSPRIPTRSSVLARIVKRYLSKVWEIFQVACDKILGGDLGARLRLRREQVEQAADAVERLIPTTPSTRGELAVPIASDRTLSGVVTDRTEPFVGDVVEVVWERYYRRSRQETPNEQRYDADDRDSSEQVYLSAAIEMTRARQERAWLRSRSAARPTRASARASVLKEHQSNLREVVEVACDEVVGRGELGERLRRRRDQVRRAVDAAEAVLPATRLGRGDAPALSDETLDELVATETDPFRGEMFDEIERRYHWSAADHYDADDRRRSELAHRDQGGTRIRDIFTAARDAVLRDDERRDRREAQVPSGQERAKQPGQAGQDPAPGRGKDTRGSRPQPAAAPAAEPAAVSVAEAGRVRLAVHAVQAELPWTQPYPGNSSHRPPALSNERFDRMAAATDDEFVRKVIAEVQQRQTFYTDYQRTESEKTHLRPAVARKHQENLGAYEKAEAERGIFSRRSSKPTWAEAEVVVIEEFEAEQLGVIEEICRDVRQRSPADVQRERQRFAPGRVSAPQPGRSPIRRTKKQQDRGGSGPSR